ncbi:MULTISPECIES: tripartite tricarboxylate transporter substrate binding protein [unclassified Achromobacter]|uniref:Bug family tripartite tricarboxylate transporter substrate binding protein n=1 Tax=unclassified Achromobacter TaxID=2626865 RepID=UPI000B515DEE|nr:MULTISPECIES: tripartite tricarboxylate transporter substrate binding protein [unclassified Achromobacter]OWT77086.1 hypothetical protein CEY04_13930 [Achromobacter sp. HZ28]OWT77967.1 hypothetical protein CEY05_08425 [Achromobacter sp. HZ34]
MRKNSVSSVGTGASGARRAALRHLAGALAICGLGRVKAAGAVGDSPSAYPLRPIRIVVPYAPGGGTDMMARLIAVGLSERLGKSAYIDNRAGAGTAIGSQVVAAAEPDGYTILITTGTLAVLPALYANLSFDPVKDFAPITLFASSPNVLLVAPDLPVKTFAQFIAYAKARREPLAYSSSGIGGTGHLAFEQIKQLTKVNMTHIPYNGGGPALQALLSGQVSAMINNVAQSIVHIEAGRLRALAVTSHERSPTLPEVPTIAESGYPQFDAQAWFGALAPAHTPAEIVERLSETLASVVADQKVSAAFQAQGVEVATTASASFANIIRDDVLRWKRVISAAGVTVN